MDDIDPWTPGVKLLHFVPEGQARSFIGKLVRWYGRKRVLKAIEDCEKASPANPQEYLVAILKNGEDTLKPWSDEWIDLEFKAGRIQIRAGESYADVRRRLRSA